VNDEKLSKNIATRFKQGHWCSPGLGQDWLTGGLETHQHPPILDSKLK
jgi:hypothetical protein